MSAGHGGQVLVAASTAAMVAGVDFIDLGEHRLRDLSQPQRLFQVQAEGLKKTFPALRTLTTAPGNLPAQATSFLGRDNDLAEVGALLAGARLITLTGVGGVGKTRLALHLAAEVCQTYPDGVWLVEFAAVGDPRAAAPVLAGVLGITQQAGKTIEQSLVNSLAGRRLLLILDNCEHLIDVVAGLAQEILSGCPQVSLLATSREALWVDGERSWPVPSLGLHDGIASPAVVLFVERARSVEPHFDLGGDGDIVCEICRRLDGIPLAIELAAARIRAMSASQIRDRLHERFRLLTGGSRRALERHQTLRHAVEWSYDLLSPAERVVLSRASVFAGGFTLEAAERVCGGGEIATSDILDLLDSLVRKSLVTVERSNAAVRYGLLETIRQFAEEQLATMNESEAARLRHAQFFAEDAEAHYEIFWCPRQLAAHQWLDQELDNLRSAFRWASDHEDVDIAAGIASSIGIMARLRLHEEAANWPLEIVDAARRVGHRNLGVLLSLAANCARCLGRLKEAKLYGEQAMALAGAADFDQFVWIFAEGAMAALFEGDTDRAIELVRAGAAHPADRRYRICLALLPYILILCGAGDEAMQIAAGIVAEVKSTGVPSSLALALMGKGMAFTSSDPVRALDGLEQAVTIAGESGNRLWEMQIITVLASTQARVGDPITALRSFLQMLDSWRRSTDFASVTYGIGTLVVLFERLGDATATATINGFLARMIETTTFLGALGDIPVTIARVRQVLGDAPFDEANKHGATMTYREVVDYAADRVQHALTALGAGVTAD
jgi:predicted ATPase